jgi:murein DD-endopeptidase MepM/ murein hydrolase activator NlpD
LLAFTQGKLNDLLARRTELQKQNAQATGDTVNADSAKVRKDRADAIAQIEFERKLALTTDDREKARLQGEAAYREEMKKTGETAIAEARRRAAVDIALDAARKKRTKEAQMIDLGSPLKGDYRVSSGYSMNRKNPVTGKTSAHPAIDYATPVGTPVYAAAAGSVTNAQIKGGNGLYTKINHGSGTESYYLHMDEVLVEVGQWVEKGQKIGTTGGNPRNADGSKNLKAGTSTGPHLDYRVKVGGEFVDPTKVSRVKGDPEKALAEALKAEEKRLEQQDDFNEKLDAEAEKRRLTTEFMQQQMGLTGEALFEARKLASVEEAVLQAQQEAAKKNLTLDDARLKVLRDTVAVEWDIANAREKAASLVDDSSGERSALLQQLETARQMGDELQVTALEAEIKKVEAALNAAIDKAIAFWKAFDTPEARTAISGLQNLKSNINLDEQARQRATFEQPMDQLQAQRAGLMEQIQYFREVGQMNVAEELRNQLRATDAELLKLIDTSLAWWSTNTGPEAQAAILNLQNMRNQIVTAQQEFTVSAGQIQQAFAGSLSESVRLFAERLVETKNPIRALGEAAISFAASFLEKIADMILQMAALKLAMKLGFGNQANGINGLLNAGPLLVAAPLLSQSGTALTASGTTLIGAAGLWMATAAQIQAAASALLVANAVGAASGGVLHSGGIAGSATRSRSVSPAWFRNATRYHSGGVAGLRANEVPAILERGEEVITKSDVRHRMNGGMESGGVRGSGPGGGRSQTHVLAIGDKEIASAMAGAAGEDVTLTHLRRNKETVRQLLRD